MYDIAKKCKITVKGSNCPNTGLLCFSVYHITSCRDRGFPLDKITCKNCNVDLDQCVVMGP